MNSIIKWSRKDAYLAFAFWRNQFITNAPTKRGINLKYPVSASRITPLWRSSARCFPWQCAQRAMETCCMPKSRAGELREIPRDEDEMPSGTASSLSEIPQVTMGLIRVDTHMHDHVHI